MDLILQGQKFVLGYVHNGNVRNEFMVSVLELLRYDSDHQRLWNGYLSCGGLYIDDNRNSVVTRFLREDFGEWLWFVDTDIKFEPEILYKLMAQADPIERPIVSALYFGRIPMKRPDGVIESGLRAIWFSKRPEGTAYQIYPNLIKLDQMHELDAVGMGCCLIHRSVLQHMFEAYKSDPWRWFAHDVTINAAGELERMGEDIAFCDRATRIGHRIYGLGHVVTHIKTLELDLGAFITYNPQCAVMAQEGQQNGNSELSGTTDRMRVYTRQANVDRGP